MNRAQKNIITKVLLLSLITIIVFSSCSFDVDVRTSGDTSLSGNISNEPLETASGTAVPPDIPKNYFEKENMYLKDYFIQLLSAVLLF